MERKQQIGRWRSESEEYWICPNHIPRARLPAIIKICWYCSTRRPISTPAKAVESIVEMEIEIIETENCFWKQCDKGENGNSAKKRTRSKYCSTDCKNKNARHRYKRKKMGLSNE